MNRFYWNHALSLIRGIVDLPSKYPTCNIDTMLLATLQISMEIHCTYIGRQHTVV